MTSASLSALFQDESKYHDDKESGRDHRECDSFGLRHQPLRLLGDFGDISSDVESFSVCRVLIVSSGVRFTVLQSISIRRAAGRIRLTSDWACMLLDVFFEM